MILTLDYKPVLASFDRPVSFKKVTESRSNYGVTLVYEFMVGPLTYSVRLAGTKRGRWGLDFNISKVNGTVKELQEYFSKILKKELSYGETEEIIRDIEFDPTADLGVGNAPKVFATVLDILEDVMGSYPVKCFAFSSDSSKKANVYRRLIRAFGTGWEVEFDQGDMIEVCRKT